MSSGRDLNRFTAWLDRVWWRFLCGLAGHQWDDNGPRYCYRCGRGL